MKPFPELYNDLEADRRLVMVILGLTLLAAGLLWFANISREVMPFLALALLAALLLAWRGKLKFAGWLAPLAGLFILTLLLFRNSGIRDTALLGFPVTIAAASLMNGRRGVIVFGLASLGVVISLGLAESFGWVQNDYSIHNTLADYLVVCVVIVLTAAMQWTVISRLNEKTRRLSRELAERQQAEKDLRNSETLYRRAIDAAGAVPYYRDARTDTYSFMGEGILRITGYSAAEMTTALWDSLEQAGFPRGKLAGMTYEEADRLTDEDNSILWECDYQIRTRDGQIRWVADTSVVGLDANGEQAGVIGILQDITERKQSEQQIQQHLHELASIHAVSQAAASQLELGALFHLVADELFKIFDIQEIYFALHDRQTNLIQFPYYRHEDQLLETSPVNFGEGLSSHVILSRQPLLINQDYERRSAELGVVRFSHGAINLQSISWLGVPIQAGEEIIGVICVMNLQRENAFTETEVRLLTTMAANVGIAIQNAQLFMDVQKELAERKQAEQKTVQTASQLAMLNEIGRAVSEVTELETVLEIIRQKLEKLVKFDFYSVRMFDADRRTVSHLAVYENGRYWAEPDSPLRPGTHAYRVFETGRSLLHLMTAEEIDEYKRTPYLQIGDRSTLTTSLIFVPLKKQSQTIGALSVQCYDPNVYTQDDLQLVEAVSIQVAIAIENARLFTRLQQELVERKRTEELTTRVNFELQRRIKELYVLNAVAQAGAASTTEVELLDIIVETLYRSLYPDIVGVAFWDESAGLLRTFPSATRGMPANIDQTHLVAELHQGVVGQVAATRQAYRVKDTANDPLYQVVDPAIRSELCVPILAGEKLVGVLDIESRQPAAFSDSDESLLMTVAGQLASALERLRAEHELRALNAELEQRVTDRTAQLEAANKELEAFSYSVSHDLRAPLRAVNGFAKILLDDFAVELSPMAQGFLTKIVESGSRMGQLIDELLDFSRLNRNPLNKQKVDPTTLARTAIEALATETANRQIEWILADMPPIDADPILFQQVYTNLIGNAVKYTGKRTLARIEIGSFRQAAEIIYFVRDNGVGFDMKYAQKLFGVFQRLHRSDEFEGVGIGLAIVQRIITRHGGRIWAEAEPERGATFFFTLERPA